MNHFSVISVWRDHGNWLQSLLKKWKKPWQMSGIWFYRSAAKKSGGSGLGTNLNRIYTWGVWCCLFNWNEMKMSIFMDPFNFCDLESFLFYVWKLTGAFQNKARAFPSLLSEVSIEEHKSDTYSRLRTTGPTLHWRSINYLKFWIAVQN